MQFEDQQGDHDGKHAVAKGFDPAEPEVSLVESLQKSLHGRKNGE